MYVCVYDMIHICIYIYIYACMQFKVLELNHHYHLNMAWSTAHVWSPGGNPRAPRPVECYRIWPPIIMGVSWEYDWVNQSRNIDRLVMIKYWNIMNVYLWMGYQDIPGLLVFFRNDPHMINMSGWWFLKTYSYL